MCSAFRMASAQSGPRAQPKLSPSHRAPAATLLVVSETLGVPRLPAPTSWRCAAAVKWDAVRGRRWVVYL